MHPWRALVGLVGLIASAFGVFTIASPDAVVSFSESILTPTGLYVIAAIRIVLGVVLVLAAAHSRLPRVLRVLGIVIVIAGALTPVFGVERSRAVLAWEASFGPMAIRLLGLVIIALGGFLIYVVRPSRQTA